MLGLLGFGIAAVSIADLALIFEGIEKATHGHGMYTPGAVIEIIFGTVQLGLGAVAVGFGADRGNDALGGGGAVLGLVGAYLLGHGIWSLTDGRPVERGVWVNLAPSPSGGTVMVSGAF